MLTNKDAAPAASTTVTPQRKIALIAKLEQTFPKTFFVFERRRQPLAIGIHKQVESSLPDWTAREVSAALSSYCWNQGYLWNSRKAGAARIGLDGAACGEVTEGEAEIARDRLAYVMKKRRERKANRRAAVQLTLPLPPPPPPPPPKKLGLADLKAAAAQRKQAAMAS
jgi:sRNA-binding protein